MKRDPIIWMVLIAIWWQSLASGMPTLAGTLIGIDRSDNDRLRRQTDYSEDETVVVDAYAVTDDPSDDGNLTVRFGYGNHQHYNPFQYGGWNAYDGAGQPYPSHNFPGGYPGYSHGPYNYPGTTGTTINPFYNNNHNYGFYYPMNTSTTSTTTSTTTTTPSSTTTRPPYGNYYVFNFRDGSGNRTEIDDGAYAGGDGGQDDDFKFGDR